MRTLNKQQLLDICYGAAFLGSGGGGPLKTALQLVESLPDRVTVNVNTVEEVKSDFRTAIVAFMGAPEKMKKIQNPQSAIAAFDRLNKNELKPEKLLMKIVYQKRRNKKRHANYISFCHTTQSTLNTSYLLHNLYLRGNEYYLKYLLLSSSNGVLNPAKLVWQSKCCSRSAAILYSLLIK